MVKALAYAVGLALVLPVSPLAAEAESGPVATETFLIPSADPAIKIYLRNRHLSGREKFRRGASPVTGIGAYRSVQKEAARQRKRQVVLGEGTHSRREAAGWSSPGGFPYTGGMEG